jgi:CBS-domain-containing membrane protein
MGEIGEVGETPLAPPWLRAHRIDLSDDELVGAMRELQGYVDVSVGDLREIYRRAYPRAVERSLRGIRARDLMRMGARPASAGMTVAAAAGLLVEQGLSSLPVVDGDGKVVGSFAESDLLHGLHAGSALQLLLRLVDDPASVDGSRWTAAVSTVMRSIPATIGADAGLGTIDAAFRAGDGPSLAVVDAAGNLLGVLSRQDFLDACARGAGR